MGTFFIVLDAIEMEFYPGEKGMVGSADDNERGSGTTMDCRDTSRVSRCDLDRAEK